MLLVTLTALCVAGFVVLFRSFESYRIALRPAIAVNYAVAFIIGLIASTPWNKGDLTPLYAPAAGIGVLFATMFILIGVSAQRVGVAMTTIAARMSLVLTVLFSVHLFAEDPGPWGWAGITLAIMGLVLANWKKDAGRLKRAWVLPIVILIGSALCDIGVGYAQRMRTNEVNAETLPTLCFGTSTLTSVIFVVMRGEQRDLLSGRTLAGGAVLGGINYAALMFLVAALAGSGLPASSLFPLMNVLAMLFGIAASLFLFRERLSRTQWAGVCLCAIALCMIMFAGS